MTIIYFLLAAIALGFLVFIHELGHYFAAKKTGMKVEIFSIGFGKPLLRWRFNDVDWQLGWLPFGGYVKIAGMEVSKKDKHTYVDPYAIDEGFFSKSPLKRILVALAGPVFNLVLAFLIFTLLWAIGGREKPFSEFTHVIGWVDPQSDLYAHGVRPGDLITAYDGKAFTNSKDLLYAAMLGDKKVTIQGYHVDSEKETKTPFSYIIQTYPAPNSLSGILTTGITTTGRYLIYDPELTRSPLPEGSPMEGSGIQPGDRLVWADGEVLFSMDQLSYLMNSQKAYLTVQRGNKTFYTRQPRVLAGDLILPPTVRNELIDWQYEAGIKKKWQELYVIPYTLSTQAEVQDGLPFIDQESKLEAFSSCPYSPHLEMPLQKGDRIIAIDGVPINTAYQLVDLLQVHHVQLIVERGVPFNTVDSWKKADQQFFKLTSFSDINAIAQTIGTKDQLKESGKYFLLYPVAPKKMDQFAITPAAKEKLKADFEEKKKEIEKVKDQTKRAQMLQYLDQSHNKYLLGIYLQDKVVLYNPTPMVLFSDIVKETWQTLKALFMGYLNPKWISGPVGIVQVIQQGWKLGIGEALFWIGAISLNLGILNLLPIPVLDGGYICLSLWEMITGKRIKPKTMERLIIPFVVILIGLLIFLTFQDVSRLFSIIF